MNFSIEKAGDWCDVGFNFQKKAFSIPKVNNLKTSKNIFGLLLESHNSGGTFRNFKKELLNLHNQDEISAILAKPDVEVIEFKDYHQVDSILKCSYNIFNGLLFGFNRFIQKNKVKDRRGIWRFDAVSDSRSSKLENSLNNHYFHHTDIIWDNFMPPNSPFDRTIVRASSQRQADRKNIEIEDSSGKITKTQTDIFNKKIEITGFKNLENGTTYAYPGWDANFFKLWS